MNKDNVRKWVAALRSGKYEQTTSFLYDNGRYCCLGVLCEIAGIQHEGRFFDGEDNFLPARAKDWIGVFDSDPLIGPNEASALNDEHGKTFSEIADLIEYYWLDSESAVEAK